MSAEETTPDTATSDDLTLAEDAESASVIAEDTDLPYVSPEDAAEDRLFALVAFGLMILLLICVVLVLIADRRPPAGL